MFISRSFQSVITAEKKGIIEKITPDLLIRDFCSIDVTLWQN